MTPRSARDMQWSLIVNNFENELLMSLVVEASSKSDLKYYIKRAVSWRRQGSELYFKECLDQKGRNIDAGRQNMFCASPR